MEQQTTNMYLETIEVPTPAEQQVESIKTGDYLNVAMLFSLILFLSAFVLFVISKQIKFK